MNDNLLCQPINDIINNTLVLFLVHEDLFLEYRKEFDANSKYNNIDSNSFKCKEAIKLAGLAVFIGKDGKSIIIKNRYPIKDTNY